MSAGRLQPKAETRYMIPFAKSRVWVYMPLVQSRATSRQIVQEVQDQFVYGPRRWGRHGLGGKESRYND